MINYNENFINKSESDLLNRGFLYGDSVFESIKIINNNIIFWEDHYMRLMSSMRIIRIEIPQTYTPNFFKLQILSTISKIDSVFTGRVRLTIFRNGAGYYTPNSMSPSFIINCSAIGSENFEVNESEFKVDLFKDYYIQNDLLSNLKTNNKLINVLAGIYANENNLDNCILLNNKKNVAEFLNGNLFIVHENKIKEMMKAGKPVINGWLQIPSTVSAEVMAHQGWDSLTIDMQHGLVDYTNALPMLQTISTTDVTPLARVNWNEPGQIMKILDAGCYGIICPMVSNKEEAERFVQACMYPPHGYRSFGPVRGLIYGGSDYAKHANDEMLKLAMIETKESLGKLDEIMSTPGVDGIYIGPADLSLAIGEEPGFDRPESTKAYSEILRILEHAKKNNIFAGIHNGTPEYAKKMIDKGFNFVTIGADQRALSAGSKAVVDKMKGFSKKEESKAY